MPERPLVSIITPTQNSAKHLARCISSVLGQCYDRIEHVVVDVASTDGTIECLQAQPATVRWTSVRSGSVTAALNHALAQARGDIVCWLPPHHEFFGTNSVELAVERMFGRPEVGAVVGKSLACDEDLFRQRLEVSRFDVALPALLRSYGKTPPPPSATFVRRQVFEWLGPYQADLQSEQDYELWLRMAAAGVQVDSIDRVLARTRAKVSEVDAAPEAARTSRQRIGLAYLHHLDRPQRVAYWQDYYLQTCERPESSVGELLSADPTELIGRQLAWGALGRPLELALLTACVDRHRRDPDLAYLLAEAFLDAGHRALSQKIYDYADRLAVLDPALPTEPPAVLVPTWDATELRDRLRTFFSPVQDDHPRALRVLLEPRSDVPATVARYHLAEALQAIGRSPDAGDQIDLVVANAEEVTLPLGERYVGPAGHPVPVKFQHLVAGSVVAATSSGVDDPASSTTRAATHAAGTGAAVIVLHAAEPTSEDSSASRTSWQQRLRAHG